MSESQHLKQTIAVLEQRRALLGDQVVDTAIAALHKQLAELESKTKARHERKQVTILFADISDFTATAERLDAELVGEAIDRLWLRLDGVITQYGGRVDKHMGDSLMALWGMERVREDDPVRAVQAALAIQEALKDETTVGDSVAAQVLIEMESADFQMRIGINTGPVFLTTVGTLGEYTAIGNSVNIASRLEKEAPVGGVLISGDTFHLVRGLFDVREMPPLQLKGIHEPFQAFLVEGERSRTFRMKRRGIDGVETHLIGREVEMKILQDSLRATMQNHTGKTVVLVGEAGMGKSRLLFEFEMWVQGSFPVVQLFQARARPETLHLPYGLLRDLFGLRFDIKDSDPRQVVREKFEGGVAEFLGNGKLSQLKAHVLAKFFGFDIGESHLLENILNDVQQLYHRALMYLEEYFHAAAQHSPVVFFLDDLHWADKPSLRIVEQLAFETRNQPWLLICLTRPELFERYSDWEQVTNLYERLYLQPLGDRSSRNLILDILQTGDEPPQALIDLIVNSAGGNPYYIEELIKMLMERCVIQTDETPWRIDFDHLDQMAVPPTLTGVLQARLDALASSERATLQYASVIGQTFWEAAVNSLVEVSDDLSLDIVHQSLNSLGRREMIFPQQSSSFMTLSEYRFKHALLHQVVYESVLLRDRPHYHARTAEWLLNESGERQDEFAALIAHHLELAGKTQRAAAYWKRAGQQAAQQYANQEAISYFTRSLELIPENELEECFAVLLSREAVYALLGEYQAQERDLHSLDKIAEKLGHEKQKAQLALKQARYLMNQNDYATALQSTRETVELAQRIKDRDLEAGAYLLWGFVSIYQGVYDQSREQLERALSLAQDVNNRQVEADSLRTLGGLCRLIDDFYGVRDYCERALDIYREINDQNGEVATLNNLGVYFDHSGDFERAISLYQQALDIFQETGNVRGQSQELNNLGVSATFLGDYSAALNYLQQGISIDRRINNHRAEAWALNDLGVVYRHLGKYATAQHYYEQGLAMAQELGERRCQGTIQMYLGLLSHDLNDDVAALEWGDAALKIADELREPSLQARILTHQGHSLIGLGQMVEASNCYHRALKLWKPLVRARMSAETLTGLANLASLQNALPLAQEWVEKTLPWLSQEESGWLEDPIPVFLTCYRVLAASQDPRANQILMQGYQLFQERAVRITDPDLRRSFAENVAWNHEIVQAATDAGLL